VTSEQWSSYMDADGRVSDVDAAREAIFRGVGFTQFVSENLRIHVMMLMLLWPPFQ
jgi:hypothetical protein